MPETKLFRICHAIKLNLGKPSLLVANASRMIYAEACSRISRIFTIFVLGWYLGVEQYGMAMLAIVCHELFRVLTRVGIGAKVVQCADAELPTLAGNARALQWIICLLVFVLQSSTAEWVSSYYGQVELASLLKMMACTHLIYPLVSVRVFLVQRRNQMGRYAFATAASVSLDNLSTAFLVVCGFGVYAVAIAKLLAAVCWVVIFWNCRVNQYPLAVCWNTQKTLCSFGIKVLASEILKALRLQIDTLFAARLLSPDVFGLYSFAKSAGVGLSQSLSSGYLSSLYPYLCSKFRQNSYRNTELRAYKLSCYVSLIFAFQALLAPWYLDLLFGTRWESAHLLVTVLCISAIPALMIDTHTTVVRALNQPVKELLITFACVMILVIAIIAIRPDTALLFAITVTTTSLIWLIMLAGFHVCRSNRHSLKYRRKILSIT